MKTPFNNIQKKWKELERLLPKIIQRKLVLLAKKNFASKSFYNEGWASRKGNFSHPLLEKTGKLKRSVRGINVPNMDGIQIGSTVEYAKYHNEGIGQVKRQFIGDHPEIRGIIIKEIFTSIKKLFK